MLRPYTRPGAVIVDVAVLPGVVLEVERKVAIVVDALRASSTVTAMFDAGAEGRGRGSPGAGRVRSQRIGSVVLRTRPGRADSLRPHARVRGRRARHDLQPGRPVLRRLPRRAHRTA